MDSRSLVILSSSPLRAPESPLYTHDNLDSRSPPFPALSKAQRLKSGSLAGEMPAGGFTGFTSVASLLRENRFPKLEEDGKGTGPVEVLAEVKDTNAIIPPKKARRRSGGAPNKVLKAQVVKQSRPDEEPPKKRGRPKKVQAAPEEVDIGLSAIPDSIPPAHAPTDAAKPDGTVQKPRKARSKPAKPKGDVAETAEVQDNAIKDTSRIDGAAISKGRKPRKSRAKVLQPEPGISVAQELEAAVDETAKTAPKKARRASKGKSTGTVSEHFGNGGTSSKRQEASVDLALVPTGEKLDVKEDAQVAPKRRKRASKATEQADALDIGAAVPRRQAWTPPREDSFKVIEDSDSREATPIELDPGHEQNQEQPKAPTFYKMIGGYEFANIVLEPPAAQRQQEPTVAFTKRQRVDFVQANVPVMQYPRLLSAPMPQPAETATVNAPKVKSPKKRPQTITELALAAYRQPAEPVPDTVKIPEFFPPPQTSLAENAELAGVQGVEETKGKRKRVARSKSPVKDGKEAKKAAKLRKKEKESKSMLLSPEAALRAINRQDLLFGTSSQLVREESPDFIRELQRAVKESEAIMDSNDLQDSISGGQGSERGRTKLGALKRSARGLWSAAARDAEEELLASAHHSIDVAALGKAQETSSNLGTSGDARDNTAEAKPHFSLSPIQRGGTPRADAICNNSVLVEGEHDNTQQSAVIVLSSSSPKEDSGLGLKVCNDVPSSSPPAALNQMSDSVLGHTSITDVPFKPSIFLPPRPRRPRLTISPRQRISLSPSRGVSPPSTKHAVSRLHEAFEEEPKSLSTNTQLPASEPSQKRLRGRPRKDPLEISSFHVVRSPAPEPVKATSPSQAVKPTSSTSFKDIDSVIVPTSKAVKPATTTRVISGPWHHIDEIEDSEPELTPSPPRRRRSPTQPLSQPMPALTLSPRRPATLKPSVSGTAMLRSPVSPELPPSTQVSRAPSPSPSPSSLPAPAPLPSAAAPSLAPSHTQGAAAPKPRRRRSRSPTPIRTIRVPAKAKMEALLPSLQANLFPLITAAVKAAPRGTIQEPSWHEKILLYDPIVLEEFTGWLEACDVVVRKEWVMIPKPGIGTIGQLELEGAEGVGVTSEKPKGKKGKRVKDKGNDGRVEDEDETVELQPWMVQKWCEEMSICCLWKGGLRGGVTAKY